MPTAPPRKRGSVSPSGWTGSYWASFSRRNSRAADLAAVGAEDRPGAGAEEAEAAPLLAALDRLEQEAGDPVVQPAEERQRRVHVRQELAHHRDQVPPARLLLEHFL
jgi:hypothetical protein